MYDASAVCLHSGRIRSMGSRAGQLPARLFHFVPTASPRNSDLRAVTQLRIRHFMSPSGVKQPLRDIPRRGLATSDNLALCYFSCPRL